MKLPIPTLQNKYKIMFRRTFSMLGFFNITNKIVKLIGKSIHLCLRHKHLLEIFQTFIFILFFLDLDVFFENKSLMKEIKKLWPKVYEETFVKIQPTNHINKTFFFLCFANL